MRVDLLQVILLTIGLSILLIIALPTMISNYNKSHKVNVPIELDYDFNR